MNDFSNQNDEDISPKLIRIWNSLKKKPKVIVFDLDYTLWPYFVDGHVSPPIKLTKRHGKEIVVDTEGFEIRGFEYVTRILKTLKHQCLTPDQHLAIASRSTTPELAMESIELLGWKSYFSSFQIYPKSKAIHMKKIKEELQMDKYEEFLFFDDDPSNMPDTSRLGVVGYLVDGNSGVDMNSIENGLLHFNSKH